MHLVKDHLKEILKHWEISAFWQMYTPQLLVNDLHSFLASKFWFECSRNKKTSSIRFYINKKLKVRSLQYAIIFFNAKMFSYRNCQNITLLPAILALKHRVRLLLWSRDFCY